MFTSKSMNQWRTIIQINWINEQLIATNGH